MFKDFNSYPFSVFIYFLRIMLSMFIQITGYYYDYLHKEDVSLHKEVNERYMFFSKLFFCFQKNLFNREIKNLDFSFTELLLIKYEIFFGDELLDTESLIKENEIYIYFKFYNDTLCSKQLTSLYYDIFIIEEQSLPLEYYAEKLAEQFIKKIKL